eukprot:225954_1
METHSTDNDTWQCNKCTFIQQSSNSVCELCGSARLIFQNGEEWHCERCTFIQPATNKRCQICQFQQKQISEMVEAESISVKEQLLAMGLNEDQLHLLLYPQNDSEIKQDIKDEQCDLVVTNCPTLQIISKVMKYHNEWKELQKKKSKFEESNSG